MQTKNPVLSRMEAEAKRNGGYADFGPTTATMTAAPPAGASIPPTGLAAPTAPGRLMAMPDVIAKTFLMFAVMLPVAAATWILNVPVGFVLLAMLAALGVGIWASVKREPSPPLFMVYAVLEGIVLGGVSKFYNEWAIANGWQTGIVGTAIVGTLLVFGLMLALYGTRIIRVTSRTAKIFTVALGGYLLLSVVSLVSSFFGVGDGFGLFGLGTFGVLFSLLGVGLAAFSLVMDFAAIEEMISVGVPEQESWRASFGLVVSLVWLYLELLRLLAILSSQR